MNAASLGQPSPKRYQTDTGSAAPALARASSTQAKAETKAEAKPDNGKWGVQLGAYAAELGVLDLDSPLPARFDAGDAAGCEALMRILAPRISG